MMLSMAGCKMKDILVEALSKESEKRIPRDTLTAWREELCDVLLVLANKLYELVIYRFDMGFASA